MSRKIDALVAEHIMGWPGQKINVDWSIPRGPLPNYSTNIADAWEVVEKFTYGWQVGLTMDNEVSCSLVVDKIGISPSIEVFAPTAPMAICIAALKAKGVEV